MEDITDFDSAFDEDMANFDALDNSADHILFPCSGF